MEFRILGPLEVRAGGVLVPLPRRRERTLLAALLLRAGEVVSTSALIDAVWDESPPIQAVGSLQNGISELRKTLGRELLQTRPPGYRLALDGIEIDAHRFEQGVRTAATLEPAARAELLGEVLALWRGRALADLADCSFASHECARLDELRLTATEDRIEAELELGCGPELVPELETHVLANPLRERLRGQLMRALYRSGRQAEALGAYKDARSALVDELGLDPSPALQELERRILRQDPTLLATGTAAPRSQTVTVEPAGRKPVTVLAAALDDVAELDPEVLGASVDRFLAALDEVARVHGGTLDRFLGAEAVAVFGVPTVHEDDALRAVRAAVELREALGAHGLTLRVGLATGEVLAGRSDAPVVGDVVGVAAALRDAAAPGVILADASVLALVRDAVEDGPETTVGARRLVAHPLLAVSGAHGRSRRSDTPFVGRQQELAALRDALGRATAERCCVGLTVLGEAGIGKTRLVSELASTLTRGRVIGGQASPYGVGAPLLPIVELVRQVAGDVTDEAVEGVLPADDEGRRAAGLVAALADPSTAVPPGEAFWAVRALLEETARDDPAIVVLDDVHWAESALLDLVEYLVERVAAPVLLLCLARPELLVDRPAWAGAMSPMSLLSVGPLGAAEAEAVLGHLDGSIDESTARRIADRCEGNPLHLEQLVAFVVDEGGDPALDGVPPTVEALLASRVDALPLDVKVTLQRAAVAGQRPTRGTVVALSDPGAPVDASLLELTRRGLLHPVRGEGADDHYRFHHGLLHDVAYASLSKASRAELHARCAAWLDRDGPGPDELVGWHLEQSYRYRAELGHDPELAVLGEHAGERLAAAGLRASKVADPAAVDLLGRAATLLPDQRRRGALLAELGPWWRNLGDPDQARRVLEEALAIGVEIGDKGLEARALVDLLFTEALTPTGPGAPSARTEVERLLAPLVAAEDERGQARAWQLIATTYLYELQLEATAHAARQSAAHSRKAGWTPHTASALIATALVHGPVPAPSALDEIDALLDGVAETRHVWAGVLKSAAVLHGMTGDDGAATEALATSRTILEEFDDQLQLQTGWVPAELIVLRHRGDAEQAEHRVRAWLESLRSHAIDAFTATALAQLADLVVERAPAEATGHLDRAARLAPADDLLVQTLIRTVGARCAAVDGRSEAACRLVAEADGILAASDALYDRARASISAARTLELCGDEGESALRLESARAAMAGKHDVRGLQTLALDATLALI